MKFSSVSVAFLSVFLFMVFVLEQSNGAKILSISFFSTKSHKIVYEPLLHKLAERGHEVTIIGPIKSDKKIPGLKNIHTLNLDDMDKEMGLPNFFEMRGHPLFKIFGSLFNPFIMMVPMAQNICRKSYALPQVQDILKEKWDLVVFAPLFNECIYGLIHQLNTTTILISQITTPFWLASSFGTPSPPSFIPLAFLGYSDSMSFFQRLINLVFNLYISIPMQHLYFPKMEQVYREMVDPNIPSINEIQANASIILANSHISFTKPRPLMPDIIDVGGLHLNPAKPVPKELDEFLSGNGDEGFIYFSMGSALKASTMPESNRKMFLEAFGKLKQRVLWKWETEEMDDLPKNVKLIKWAPQQDVLGHKNIRMFITHGGHGSTQEAIFHGVPLVGIPMLGDQANNMKAANQLGFAVPLEFTDLSVEVLTTAINEVLSTPSYKAKAQELSALFHDQIDKPLDRAVYWTEYVLRHKGAPHLRSAARDLNFVQYHSIDVVALLAAIGLVTLFINFIIARTLFRKCCGSKISKSKSSTKTKKTQ